ncbi:hypothetical protein SUGI_0473910 [Cryptomeria japonica]|nr:hypothetical protein SUGI_0473910 [Cryptomeria japonica]
MAPCGLASYYAMKKELESELISELKRKLAVEETLEMDVEVWSKLPEELLMRVLSHLPTLIMRKFKIVCKSFNNILLAKQIHLSVPAFLFGGMHGCSSYPLIHDSHDCWYHDSFLHHLYLLQSLPTYPLRKLTLRFLATRGKVVTTCKSLLCYRSDRTPPNLYSICNPITRTWKSLPPPIQLLSETHFIAMAFDPCARRCLLVIGVNNNSGGHRNQLVMEIFDSQSSTWTKFEMDMPLSICPKGEGVFSRGTFYWINYTTFDQSRSPKFRYDVVGYNVEENRWDVIKKPQTTIDVPEFEYQCYYKLTGYDGKIILVDQIDMSLRKLNIEGRKGPSWSELQAFPRSPYEETVRLRNLWRADVQQNFKRAYPQIVMNSCGWVLVHLPGKKIYVYDAEGKMVRTIEGKLLRVFELKGWGIPIHAYEINNAWWP